jgi:hypothetical protein
MPSADSVSDDGGAVVVVVVVVVVFRGFIVRNNVHDVCRCNFAVPLTSDSFLPSFLFPGIGSKRNEPN